MSHFRLAATVIATVMTARGALAQAAPRRLVLVPEAAITTEEGPSAVSDVADVAVGRDGSVYVAQRQAHAVRVFAADGRPVRSMGRAGEGPGEFPKDPARAGWRGDTLVVADPYGQRLVGFRADGREAFTRDYARIEKFLPWAVMADGQAFGERLAYSRDIVSGQSATLDLLAANGTSGPARTLVRLPLRHHTLGLRIGSGPQHSELFTNQPFADADLFDVDPAGRWFVTVARPAAADARRATFSLTWRSPGGAVLRTTTVPYAPARLTADKVREMRATYADIVATSFPSEPRGRIERMVADALFAPESYPPVNAVVSGNDGSTWVRRGGPTETATWMVFDARGRLAAYVTAPAKTTLYAATATHAWGTTLNENDVQILTRFALRPARGG